MATAVVMLLMLLVGGGAFAFLRRSTVETAGSGSGTVLVVAENGNVAVEQAASPGLAGGAVPTTALASAGATAPPPAPTSPPTRGSAAQSRRAARSPGAAEDFSAVVAKRAADIRRCFAEADGDDVSRSEISMRFEVGAGGDVTGLTVLPPAIGATPLGACLVKVGRGIAFAPRPAPIAFRIPVAVQLRRQAERGP